MRLLVAGGGCAGLSLAYRLSRTDLDVELTVIEARERYERDRTWCQWNTSDHPFTDCVVDTWSQWSVSQAGENVRQHADDHSYQMIDSGRFYDQVLNEIDDDPRVSLSLDDPVKNVFRKESGVELETTDAEHEGDWLVDTRRPEQPDAQLTQHFLGWEVEFNEPCLDPEVVTLMDFQPPDGSGLHFVYILPRSETVGLVEATWVSRELLSENEYGETLDRYIQREFSGVPFEVRYEEFGAIPLETAFHTDTRKRQVTIGTAGGATRPSTGYTFQGIQRQVEQLIEDLREGQLEAGPIPAWNRRDLYLDAPLLKLIQEDPEHAQRAMFELFKGTNGDQLARFLMGDATGRDLLTVFSSMPPFTMIRYSTRALMEGL